MPENQPWTLRETIWYILLPLLIVVPLRVYVAQPFIVSGSSMVSTFLDGEYLVIDEISYQFHPPARGDVIVFHYPKDPSKYFIKRIIGLPGETVTGDAVAVTITEPDGKKIKLNEPYTHGQTPGAFTSPKLGADEYFVMGDNRTQSLDSRVWGPVAFHFITGRAWLRLLPFQTLSVWPGATAY